MKASYRVILPIEIDGKKYEHGSVVSLDMKTAEEYAFALLPAEEKK
ncbi:MAG: hypothetical protein KGL39_11500 [Patescibacteria group bacterium]|nr:hypothetical protein [Patescibacteria group bacterium]